MSSVPSGKTESDTHFDGVGSVADADHEYRVLYLDYKGPAYHSNTRQWMIASLEQNQ